MEGTKKIKSMSFHQYSWNSEVETTWISSIGWHHKTSIIYSISDSIRDIQRLESGDNKPGENTWKILNENMQDLKDMLSAETKFRVKTRLLAKGSFFNYTDKSLPIIDHLPGYPIY